jgi:Protein of unknown function (DUF1573)
MRRVVLTVLGLLLLTPVAPGQEAPTGWAAKLFRDADGKTVPLGHDFGTVPKGAMLQFRFPMTNIYAVPLQMDATVSCGCVTATPNPRVLQPRETGSLDITMDTTRFSGQKSVTVQVTVRHPQYWSGTAFNINAFCRGDVVLDPAAAVFGVVPRGQPATKELVVQYHGQQPWQIVGLAQNDAGPFDVRYREEVRRPGQVAYRVYLTLKGDAPAGSLKGELHLVTNDPNNRLVPIPYDATVQAALAVVPDVARLGALTAGGEAASRRVLVRGNKPFRIVAVEGQGDGLTVDPPTAVAPVQLLTIKFQPTQPGAVQRTLTIRTDLDGGASVTARVEATVSQ